MGSYLSIFEIPEPPLIRISTMSPYIDSERPFKIAGSRYCLKVKVAPSDYHFFPKLKDYLRGMKFKTK